MATVQRYVNTNSTPGGDGTTNNTTGANRAYASWAEWETAERTTSSDDHIVTCSGGADTITSATVMLGWAVNSITCEVASDNRQTSSSIDTGKYHIAVNFNGQSWGIRIQEIITWDGIPMLSTFTGSPTAGVLMNCADGGAAGTLVQNAVFDANDTMYTCFRGRGTDYQNCFGIGVRDTGRTFDFNANHVACYVGNCTAIQNATGSGHGFYSSASNVQVKNCIAQGANPFGTTFESSSDYNLATDTSAPGSNSVQSSTLTFVDASGDDYRLAASDTDAIDSGDDLSGDANYGYSTDAFQTSREASWDIGGHEYVAAATAKPRFIVRNRRRSVRTGT